jgi:hypothetical protein
LANHHQLECTTINLTCPFAQFGCIFVGNRADYKVHMVEDSDLHVGIILERESSIPTFGSISFGTTPFKYNPPLGSSATSTPFLSFSTTATNPFAVSNPAPTAPTAGGVNMFSYYSSRDVADAQELRRRKIVKARTAKKFQAN